MAIAILWRTADGGEWIATELAAATLLSAGSVELNVIDIDAAVSRTRGPVVLLYPQQRAESAATRWLVLAPIGAGVEVNGMPLDTGIRMLADRDAIRLPAAATVYFSTQRPARIEPYAGDSTHCPRCRLEINEGDEVVCCPSCRAVHHERAADGHTCWTYASRCTLCDQTTDLASAQLSWTPARL